MRYLRIHSLMSLALALGVLGMSSGIAHATDVISLVIQTPSQGWIGSETQTRMGPSSPDSKPIYCTSMQINRPSTSQDASGRASGKIALGTIILLVPETKNSEILSKYFSTGAHFNAVISYGPPPNRYGQVPTADYTINTKLDIISEFQTTVNANGAVDTVTIEYAQYIETYPQSTNSSMPVAKNWQIIRAPIYNPAIGLNLVHP